MSNYIGNYYELIYDTSIFSLDYELTGINFYTDTNNYITAIEPFYNNYSVGILSSTNYDESNDHINNIVFEESERLVKIKGCYNDFIYSLLIILSSGREFLIGNKNTSMNSDISTDNYIVSLKVGFTNYLSYIETIDKENDYTKIDNYNYGKIFNDSITFKISMNSLTKIILYYDSLVKGIELEYLDGSYYSFCNNKNTYKKELNLRESEKIVKLIVRAGEMIDSLLILTNKGNYISTDGLGGFPHYIDISEGSLEGIEGGYKNNLHNIKLLIN